LAAISSLINYLGICITYLRFYAGIKAQGISRDSLPFKGFGQPFTAWFALVFLVAVIITNGFPTWSKGGWDISAFLSGE
jgi:amino acid transporter